MSRERERNVDGIEALAELIAQAEALVIRMEAAAENLRELSRFSTALELMLGAGWELARRGMPSPLRRRKKRDRSHLTVMR
jgi:hypothetical protein